MKHQNYHTDKNIIKINMGKCVSKTTLRKDKTFSNEEDHIISSFERKAPFARIKLEKLETAFEKHQFDQRLTIPDLRLALNDLELNPELLKNPQSHFSKFFEAMLEPDRLFLQRKLVLSAVLTSGESDQVKIRLMRKYYDLNKNQEISLNEVEVLVEEIIQVSIKIIPMMAVKDSFDEEKGLMSEEQMKNYNFNMEKIYKSYKRKLVKKIMKGEESISGDAFDAAFQRQYVKVALNSSTVRKKLRLLFKEKMMKSENL
jgi:hypothetical protein